MKQDFECQKNKNDSRKREVSITPQGRKKVLQVSLGILPDVNAWFQDWGNKDIEQFIGQLQKLAHWLDKNRLPNEIPKT